LPVYFSGISMSEYVESRYALLILRQAMLSSDVVARKLLATLVTDLPPSRGTKYKARTKAMEAIRALSVSFEDYEWPPIIIWETAHEAAKEWCAEAGA
jgi:hypothetical protein